METTGEDDITALTILMGKDCQQETKMGIRHRLTSLHSTNSAWVFERLIFSRGKRSYIAGQGYIAEMLLFKPLDIYQRVLDN